MYIWNYKIGFFKYFEVIEVNFSIKIGLLSFEDV